MLTASTFALWPVSLVESLGFVTGGICVWMVIREHSWNWPVGLTVRELTGAD